jgi:hypothetical protein
MTGPRENLRGRAHMRCVVARRVRTLLARTSFGCRSTNGRRRGGCSTVAPAAAFGGLFSLGFFWCSDSPAERLAHLAKRLRVGSLLLTHTHLHVHKPPVVLQPLLGAAGLLLRLLLLRHLRRLTTHLAGTCQRSVDLALRSERVGVASAPGEAGPAEHWRRRPGGTGLVAGQARLLSVRRLVALTMSLFCCCVREVARHRVQRGVRLGPPTHTGETAENARRTEAPWAQAGAHSLRHSV